MAQNKTDICKLALGILGVELINDIDADDNTAELCRAFIQQSIDAVVADLQPDSAKVENAALAADGSYTTSPTDRQWSYRYNLPPDVISLVKVADGEQKYSIQGNYLLTEQEAPLYISYVSRISNMSLYEPQVVDAIAMKLAIYLAPSKNKQGERKSLLNEYIQFIRPLAVQAKNRDNAHNEPLGNSKWLNNFSQSTNNSSLSIIYEL